MKTKLAAAISLCLMLMNLQVGLAQTITADAQWAAGTLRYVLGAVSD